VRQESTGWRDAEISERHRAWGAACSAADLDLLLVEYSCGAPVAVVEYKHFKLIGQVDTRHATYRALSELATRAAIPAFIAYYWPGTWAVRCDPLNHLAEEHTEPGRLLTERQFVTLLYRLRSRVVRDELLETLGNLLPETMGVAS
jgi:hypothetical protein